METVNGIDRLQSRYIIALLLFTGFILPELITLVWSGVWEYPWYWVGLGYYYPVHLTDLLFLAGAVVIIRPDLRGLFGALPSPGQWRLLLHVAFLLFSLSAALLFAIYLPLSYPFPDFIRWWLEWSYTPAIYLASDGSLPIAANLLGFLSLVVFAPLCEELLFRGFLLHRWARRWGMSRAVIASSLLFGVLHPDPFSTTLFGVGMCLLYLHTRSLWVPIFAHAINNGAVWLLELYGVLEEGFGYYDYELSQFREEWWYGVLWAVAAIIAASRFFVKRRRNDTGSTRFFHLIQLLQ